MVARMLRMKIGEKRKRKEQLRIVARMGHHTRCECCKTPAVRNRRGLPRGG